MPTSWPSFHGPHGYISPTGYRDENPAVPNVPTSELRPCLTGRVRIDDAGEKFALVRQALTRAYEGECADAWRLPAAASNAARMRAIVGFTLQWNASRPNSSSPQNRSAADQAAVIAALEAPRGSGDTAWHN